MPTLAELYELAVRHHAAGDLEQAEAFYRRILEAEPTHADALHNRGLLAHRAGQTQSAVQLVEQAITHQPGVALYHYNLGVIQMASGNVAGAVASLQQALRINPNLVEAYNHLGIALAAIDRRDEAIAAYRQGLRLQPRHLNILNNLANLLKAQGSAEAAIALYRQALALDPNRADLHNNLGIALGDQKQEAEAVACFRAAVRLNSRHADALNNLGAILIVQGAADEAIACFRQALAVNPEHVSVLNNLGLALRLQGEIAEAAACHRRALALKPDFAAAHANLLYLLLFDAATDQETLYAEHRRWNDLHARPLQPFIQPHANQRDPERRLRIGYVSPDMRSHPVGRFLVPLLAAHDHGGFEIYCYSSVENLDALTERCRACADVWRDVQSLSDEQLAEAIRRDRIDILVDLTMHMAHSRLLMFARKPAPVQVTYLAYCGTTGLETMDYRLTDPYLDPDERNQKYYSEKSVRLPETYWCYEPAADTPERTPLPASQTGHVTFGCLNTFSKSSLPALETWSRLLRELPESRLILFVPNSSARDRVSAFFAARGIAAERLEFVAKVPLAEYFRTYERIDMALDPFPYGGGTTTCDALWMGVPVVCLEGQTALGRGGVSILSNVGLSELFARNTGEYVRIAKGWATDTARLSDVRANLRERMRQSPLMDAPNFAKNVEMAYRSMWRAWCAGS